MTLRVLTDFRKTALVAGIAISLSLLWSYVTTLLTGPHRSSSELIAAATVSLFILVLELPMPVFLVLLYRTGIRPSPSRTLQYVLIALIAIRAVSLLLFVRNKLDSGILPDVSHRTLPASSTAWFLVLPGSHLWVTSYAISGALTFASQLLFISFLVAFAKQSAPAHDTGATTARPMKKAAAIAIVTRALLMVSSVLAYVVYANAVRTYGKAGSPASTLPMLRGLLFELPALIVAWIIYRSIRISQAPDPS